MKLKINMTATMIVTVFGRNAEHHRDDEKPLSKLDAYLVSEVTRISSGNEGIQTKEGKNEQRHLGLGTLRFTKLSS